MVCPLWKIKAIFLVCFLVFAHIGNVHSQSEPCETQPGSTMTLCKKLDTLDAELHWNYSTHTRQLDIIFRASAAPCAHRSSWVAWGLNLGPRPRMIETRALISIRAPDGTLKLGTYNVTTYTKLGCELQPSKIDVDVRNRSTSFDEQSKLHTINATLIVPMQNHTFKNRTYMHTVYHVWQMGCGVSNMTPSKHVIGLGNLDSSEVLDLSTGWSASHGRSVRKLRIVHGVLNMIGWGILLPIGAIIMRYFRSFPFKIKWCLVLHVSIQMTAYSLGTIGWAIGLALGKSSKDYKFKFHGTLGNWIFGLATLQIMALCLKPGEKDTFRKYWDIYHHFLGYSLIGLTVTNIIHGIDILRPGSKWRWAYVAVLALLGCVTLVLEIVTWVKFMRKKKGAKKEQDRTGVPKTQEPPQK